MDGDSLHATSDRPLIPRRQHPNRRTIRILLIFVTCVLVANALIGERGLLAALSANREYCQLSARILALRSENEALREEARLLREEPNRLEELARRELGLIRPGERLFIVPTEPPAMQAVKPPRAEAVTQ